CSSDLNWVRSACLIPPRFVLNCDLPNINARSNWLRFGAFRSPPAPSFGFTDDWPLSSRPTPHPPRPPPPPPRPTPHASPLTPHPSPLTLHAPRSAECAVHAARRAGYSTPPPGGVNMLRNATFKFVAVGTGPIEEAHRI